MSRSAQGQSTLYLQCSIPADIWHPLAAKDGHRFKHLEREGKTACRYWEPDVATWSRNVRVLDPISGGTERIEIWKVVSLEGRPLCDVATEKLHEAAPSTSFQERRWVG